MILNKKNFFLFLNQKFLFEKNPYISVAVSGGPDSMALVYLLNEWIKKKDGRIVALLVDHKIRKESFYESQKIKSYLDKLKINSKILSVPSKYVVKKNMNEARENRYNQLINFCKKNNILHLFLGHHADDNLETYLLRKIAGSNLEGLASINLKIVRDKIQLIRPLLNYSKNDILKFNKKNKIYFINDPSNLDEKHTRVIVRNYLSKTKYVKRIKKDFQNIKFQIPYYKLMINQILHKLIININSKNANIDIKEFKKLDKEIKEKIILRIFSFFDNKNKKIRLSKVNILLSHIDENKLKLFNLSNMIVRKDKNFLSFSANN